MVLFSLASILFCFKRAKIKASLAIFLCKVTTSVVQLSSTELVLRCLVNFTTVTFCHDLRSCHYHTTHLQTPELAGRRAGGQYAERLTH